MTSAAGSGTGRRRSSTLSNNEKIALLTPMPSPSDSTATADTQRPAGHRPGGVADILSNGVEHRGHSRPPRSQAVCQTGRSAA